MHSDLIQNLRSEVDAAHRALSRGDITATERHCRTLIEAAPQDPRAWALLAETALLRDRLDAAQVCAARAVHLAPADPFARVMLGKVCLREGDLVAALKAAEAAEACLATAPQACDSLAALFGLLGRHRRALELSQRAVADRPRDVQALFNLAATERMLGLLEEAENHCDEAIGIQPGFAPAHYIRSDLRTQNPARNHVAAMRALLGDPQLDVRSQVLLRYALAKECEDLDEHDQAFSHVATGARLWHQCVRHDAAAELADIDRLMHAQTGQWLSGLPKSGNSDAPIMVCGLPRTGTTLAERILAGHSAAASVGETGVFPVEAARAGRSGSATAYEALGRSYIRVVESVFAPGRERFIDKTLVNFLYCGLIHAALPNARIILLLRNPMDCAWALYKAHFQTGFMYSYDLTELADYYLAYRRLVRHWQRTLPPAALLVVRYEDLVLRTRELTARMLDFLGLPWEESTLRFNESSAPSATASAVQVRRPLYATSINKWRLHATELAPFRDRLSRTSEGRDLLAESPAVG